MFVFYLTDLCRFDPRYTRPVVAFHGTAEGNIPNILRIGLVVPGQHGVKHATDNGWYGKGDNKSSITDIPGIYLSPNPSLSIGYCRGGGKLLVCAVLLGKACKLKGNSPLFSFPEIFFRNVHWCRPQERL